MFINNNIFRHLKLEIAPPIPALNEWKKSVQGLKPSTVGSLFIVFINPLTASPDYIRFFLIYWHNKYGHLLNILKIKSDTNQQDLKIVNLHSVKSESKYERNYTSKCRVGYRG